MKEEVEMTRVYDFLKGVGQIGSIAILCDRLWPRGVSKAALEGVPWMKEWAPSRELREAFHAGTIPFGEFRDCYRIELGERRATIAGDLRALGLPDPQKTLRLLSASRDIEHSHLPVLKDYLAELLPPRPTP